MRKSKGIVVAVLAVACLAACGKSPEERIAEAAIGAMTGTDVSVDKDGEKVTFGSGKDAMTISGGDSAQLPAGFPKDVFLPARYKVESVMDSAGFTMVAVRAPGKVPAVAAAAQKHMQGAGWKQSMAAMDDETNHLLAYENARGTALLSFTTDEGEGVVYSVQLSQKQP